MSARKLLTIIIFSISLLSASTTDILTNIILIIYYRPRMAEMSFVLKAVSTLLVTLKKAPPSNSKYNAEL